MTVPPSGGVNLTSDPSSKAAINNNNNNNNNNDNNIIVLGTHYGSVNAFIYD